MTLVVDASLVVAALIDSGPDGTWAEDRLASEPLAAPHLMPAESTNIIRRSVTRGAITADAASLAIADLAALRVAFFPYEPFGSRVWELRENVTAYDGWYVALAESLDAALGTLDVRLTLAPGPRCTFATPASAG